MPGEQVRGKTHNGHEEHRVTGPMNGKVPFPVFATIGSGDAATLVSFSNLLGLQQPPPPPAVSS
jgi:hypothetical protein